MSSCPCMKGMIDFPRVVCELSLNSAGLVLNDGCRYASQAALEKHESSDNYKEFFKTMMEEQLLAGVPVITKGRYCHAFRR